jgi:ribosomal-protein-alanine N-acetyltransferase
MLELRFQPFPVLTTVRLQLREIVPADVDAIYSLRSDPKVMEFLDRPLAKSRDEAVEFIQKIIQGLQKNEGITWAITVKGDSTLIGTIGYWKVTKEHYRAEIGYLLSPVFQGQGIMHEALMQVIDYGFNQMKIHSIEANVNPANAPSIKLLEKNGFIREAYHRENYYFNGKFLDSAIYSLLNSK